MSVINELFNGRGYIDGITIVDLSGEILFTAKFNNKLHSGDLQEDYCEVVGKKLTDVWVNLTEKTSSVYQSMRLGVPIYAENQPLQIPGKKPIRITSLSIPIKSCDHIVGAIDLSQSETIEGDEAGPVIRPADEILRSNRVDQFNETNIRARFHIDDIITADPRMLAMKKQIKKAAENDLPVLIYGETGTGKELVAHSIHNLSKRRNKPFIVQNCAAIPETLMESMLFGTSKGAFTGAIDNIGLLDLANGGTLFLDELDSLPVGIQSKLLRVAQGGEFRKVGSETMCRVDVRLLTAVNREPKRIVSDGRMREDLYYRLSVFQINIPPLRERIGDISLLLEYFISRYNARFGKQIAEADTQLLRRLESYSWPGNVRELENLVAYGVSIAEPEDMVLQAASVAEKIDRLEPAGASEEERQLFSPSPDMALTERVALYEKNLIRSELKRCDYNITAAAKVLGVPRQTLSRKAREYELL